MRQVAKEAVPSTLVDRPPPCWECVRLLSSRHGAVVAQGPFKPRVAGSNPAGGTNATPAAAPAPGPRISVGKCWSLQSVRLYASVRLEAQQVGRTMIWVMRSSPAKGLVDAALATCHRELAAGSIAVEGELGRRGGESSTPT